MKILHLISSSGFFGAENVAFLLSKEQIKQGLSVTLGVFRNSLNPHLEVCEIAKAHDIPVAIFECNGRFDVRAISKIRGFIRRNQFDLIHSHGYKSDFYAFSATLFQNVKRISTCHTWYSTNGRMKFYELIDKLLLSRFNGIIAVSKSLTDELLKCGVSKERVHFIRNGIDISLFKISENVNIIKKELNIDPDTIVVGTIGRFALYKGQIHLLKAFKRVNEIFSDSRCLFVGDGPLKENLEVQMSSLGLKGKVIFLGIRKDIPRLLSIMDIFVLPSLKEGMPMVLLEAMASKKPIVATRVGAIPELIEDRQNGLLVEPDNAETISNAILTLIKDAEMARSLGTQALIKAKNEFSSERMANDYLSIYRQVLN